MLDRPPLTQISGGFPPVVQMADGDGCKTLIPSLAKELTNPLTEFFERGSTGGCRGGYPWRSASGYPLRYTGLHRPLPAGHVPGLAILVKRPREWLPGIPTDLQPIAKDQAVMGLGEGPILKRDQVRLNPTITVILRY